MRQVELSVNSMHKGASFIVDSEPGIFVWHGTKSHRSTRSKAVEVASRIKEEVGCKHAVQVLLEGEETSEFWRLVGGPDVIMEPPENNVSTPRPAKGQPQGSDISGGEEEEILDEDTSDWLYSVEEEAGKAKVVPLEETEFTRSMLDSNKAYILDCETEIFVWFGKNASLEKKRTAQSLAEEFMTLFERPSWTTITRVQEGSEPVLFREKFVKWYPKPGLPEVRSRPSNSFSSKVAPAAILKPLPGRVLHSMTPPAEPQLNISNGIIEIWFFSTDQWVSLPETSHGVFSEKTAYVCHFVYEEASRKIKSRVYFWEGRDAPNKAYIAYRFGFKDQLADKMHEMNSDDPEEIRVVQGKEAVDFMDIFGGNLVIHKDNYQTNKSMFQVKGSKQYCRATQLDEADASALNSADSFVLVCPREVVYIWYGLGSDRYEREWAATVAEKMQIECNCTEIIPLEEDSENEDFWIQLGGKKQYANDPLLRKYKEPRLFQCQFSNQFNVEEIVKITQGDLADRGCFILDAFFWVFVWNGSNSGEALRNLTLQTGTLPNSTTVDAFSQLKVTYKMPQMEGKIAN